MYKQTAQADSEAHSCCVYADSLMGDNGFATEPLVVIRPVFQQPDEEELHTSFERAISDRVLALNRRLKLISGPLAHDGHVTDVLAQTGYPYIPDESSAEIVQPETSHRPVIKIKPWQRVTMYASLGMMLLMAGFDLMGLLVLHAR